MRIPVVFGTRKVVARRELVVQRSHSFNGMSVYSYSTDWDLIGRPTNAVDSLSSARAWRYNRRSELVDATIGTNLYGYDHRHRRIRKVVRRYDGVDWQIAETHTFVWDGMNIVLEKIAFADNSTRMCEYFWGPDKSGTERGAGGVGGLLAVSVDGQFYIPCYDPYGNVIDEYGAQRDTFAFGFSTKYRDRETNMLAYQRRFYRPDHGRWLNRDPIEEEGGENLYAFCRNSPISIFDINGEFFLID